MTDATLDVLGDGVLRLWQPQQGYRFNVDALALACFAAGVTNAPRRVIDLGAGCGVIGLLLALRWPDAEVQLIERQAELAGLCSRNIVENGLHLRAELRMLDYRRLDRWRDEVVGGTLLVANPPYYRPGYGRMSPNSCRAAARHELNGTLGELVVACRDAMSAATGWTALALILPVERRAELGCLARGLGLALRERPVCSLPGSQPVRALALLGVGDLPEISNVPFYLRVSGGEAAELRWLRSGWRPLTAVSPSETVDAQPY